MRRRRILGSLAVLALMIASCPRSAVADSLTRASCWSSHLDSGARRTLCFAGSPRVKMTNRNRTSDDKGWSSCEWSGLYAQTDARVTVAFAPSSGKCSNGAASPLWTAVCNFSGDELSCEGGAIVDGKIYEIDLTFK